MQDRIEFVNQLIRSRRSVFPPSYSGDEIPRRVIETILENANYAPTHKLTEPWRFQVFRKKGLEKLGTAMAELYKQHTPGHLFLPGKYEATRDKILRASCVIAICMKTHRDTLPEWEELAAVACAVQNMWLTATALQVGAYWSSPDMIMHLQDFLGLDPDEKCVGLFYMGYHNEPKRAAQRKPIGDKITWIE